MILYRLTIKRAGYRKDRVKYVPARHLKMTLRANYYWNQQYPIKIERAEVGEFEDVTAEFGK